MISSIANTNSFIGTQLNIFNYFDLIEIVLFADD